MSKAHIRPNEGEKLNDFVSRFMSHPHNIDTYPDDKQRLAIAHSLYEEAKKKKKADFGNSGADADVHADMFINSRTSGTVRTVMENGRSHLVSPAVPIVGDIVMNEIFYPDDVVTNSMSQFEMLPAPANHPRVRGIRTSIRNPLAANAHNIGGFTRKPVKEGKKVKVEFWLDESIAKSSEKGLRVYSAMENGQRLGISTGGRANMSWEEGVGPTDGKSFKRRAHALSYDHCAVLLDEEAAGAHAGTELVTNENGVDLFVCNVSQALAHLPGLAPTNPMTYNELMDVFRDAVNKAFAAGYEDAYARDLVLTEPAILVSAKPKSEPTYVLLKVPFSVNESNQIMLKVDEAQRLKERTIYEVDRIQNNRSGNDNPKQTEDTKQEDESMDFTNEEAKKQLEAAGFKVLSTAEFSNMEKDQKELAGFRDAEEKRLQTKRDQIIENGLMTAEDLEGMGEKGLDKLLTLSDGAGSGSGTINNALRQGGNGSHRSDNKGGKGKAVEASDLADIENAAESDKADA